MKIPETYSSEKKLSDNLTNQEIQTERKAQKLFNKDALTTRPFHLANGYA
jgi:hypothetical protein